MNIRSSFLYTVLSSIFCGALIVSNIIAGKLWQAPFDITLTCGVFLFPIVYIIGDIIPEVYGLSLARKTILLGFIVNLIAVVAFELTLMAPPPVYWQSQAAFNTVLGFTPRLLAASFVAYLIGTNVNAWIMVTVQKLTKGKWLWLRTISSTVVGESLDSTIFILIAFYGVLPNAALPIMILSQAAFKTVYEVLATPLTYAAVNFCKKAEMASN